MSALAGLLTLAVAPHARAEPREPKGAAASERPCPGRNRALAAGVALVPGLVVRGAGHWVACEPRTARRLLELEGAAVGATAISGAGLALTGASRYVVAPLALGALAGASVFAVTLLADVYGVVAPSGGFGAAPPRVAPLELMAGVSAIYDPHFAYRSLLSYGFRADLGWLWLAPRADLALNAKNHRYALHAGHRFIGKTATQQTGDGTYVELRAGLTDHAYVDDGFSLTTAEASFAARLDLQAIGETLRGSFAEAQIGYGRQWSRYEGFPDNYSDQLLFRSAFGIYLGHGKTRGEASVAYDHRRDTYAGGLHVPGIAAGYLGFVGARGHVYFGRIGLGTEIDYGSALVAGLFVLLKVGS